MASSGEARLAAYRRRVQARYTPVVTTVCTPDADAACAAAGVSFADLVRPHASDVRGLDVPMWHNPDAPPYVIDAFAMRVHSLAECRHASSDQAEAHADASHAPWSDASERSLAAILDAIPRNVTSLVALARDGRAPGDHASPETAPSASGDDAAPSELFHAPWLDRHASRLDRALMFSEYESVDHPRAFIFVASARSPDPAGELAKLSAPFYQRPDSYPPLLRSEAADPDVPKHFVILWDASDGSVSRDDADRAAASIRATHGDASATVLPMNSAAATGASPGVDRSFYRSSAETRVVSPTTSCSFSGASTMSASDVAAHEAFCRSFVAGTLLPSMETKLKALNASVANTRKGLKNQLKSFWGRSTGATTKPEGDGGYTFRSEASEIRLAGDLAFMLKDHELAAGHYRLVQGDYKADKAYRRLGAIHEALGHALAMRGWGAEGAPFRESRREAESAFEAAARCHQKFRVPGARRDDPHGNKAGTQSGGGAFGFGAVAAPSTPPPAGTGRASVGVGALGGVGATPPPAGSGSGGGAAATTPDSSESGPGSPPPPPAIPPAVLERTRWATRAALAHASFLSACGATREAAAALTRASAEEAQPHLRAASLLEGASLFYLGSDPPAVRKYAVHAVLAGHRYNQAGNRACAVRCYAAALPAYEGEAPAKEAGAASSNLSSDVSAPLAGWWRAREHLHFALGRQTARAGSPALATRYFRELLECAKHQTHRDAAKVHATYLREFAHVAKASAAAKDEKTDETDASLFSLGDADANPPAPAIDVGRVRVRFEDGRGDAVSVSAEDAAETAKHAAQRSAAARSADPVADPSAEKPPFAPPCASWPSERWDALEADGLVPDGARGVQATWLDKPRALGAEQRGVCAAGEDVSADVTTRNPLACPVAVVGLRLRTEFRPEEPEGGRGTSASASASFVSAFASPPLVLRPGETRVVPLRCRPLAPGSLRILGVEFALAPADDDATSYSADATPQNDSDSASALTNANPPLASSLPPALRGFARFDVRAPRTRRGANGAWSRDVPRERRLAFSVVAPTPRLEAALEGLPMTCPDGAAFVATLRVRNAGRPSGPAAHNVRVRVPGGRMAPEDPEWARANRIGEEKGGEEGEEEGGGKEGRGKGGGVVYAPKDWATLEAGAERAVRFVVRALGDDGKATEGFGSSSGFGSSTEGFASSRLLDLPVLVGYEPPPPAPALLKYRVVRLAAGTRRAPSLRVEVTATPSATNPASYILRAAVTNEDEGGARYELAAASLVQKGGSGGGASGSRVGARLRAMGAPAATRRVVEPGRRVDVLMLAEPVLPEDEESDAEGSAEQSLGSRLAFGPPKGSRGDATIRALLPSSSGRGSGSSRGFDLLSDLDLLLEWETVGPALGSGSGFAGAHRVSLADRASKDAARDDVRWTLEGPTRVAFEPQRPPGVARIPVTFRVHNPGASAARVTFEALTHFGSERESSSSGEGGGWTSTAGEVDGRSGGGGGGGGAGGGGAGWSSVGEKEKDAEKMRDPKSSLAARPASLAPGRAWAWTGPARRTVAVGPGETLAVPLRAEAFAPGMHALGEYRVAWECIEEEGEARGERQGVGEGVRGRRFVKTPAGACNYPFVVDVASADWE